MRITVASTNPVKIGAALQAIRLLFPDAGHDVQGVACTLPLPAQPMGHDETRDCALQRARFALDADAQADIAIGMEGGCALAPDVTGVEQLYQIVWIIAVDRTGRIGESSAASFILPPAIRDLVLAGDELGMAGDKVFGQTNSKQKTGTTGLLTNDAITRLDLYVQPTILALVPLCNRDLYKTA